MSRRESRMEVDLPGKIELIADLPGHEDKAWHVAWNPARPLLASCSADKTVRLYHYNTISTSDTSDSSSSLKFELNTSIATGHTKTVRGIAWSPSGQTLATASFDANIGIWQQEEDEDGEAENNVNGGGEWECVSLLEGHETECKSVAYSSTGTLLASCSRDKTVWIWEVHPDADFECMGVLMEHSQDVKCVAWHPTEEILASASYDDTIKLYQDDPSDDWFCATTLTGHTSTVWSIAWEPKEGGYLASSSDDRTIRIWRRLPGKGDISFECAAVIEGHERSVYSISWAPAPEKEAVKDAGGKNLGWLASTGGDGTVLIWQINEVPGEPDKSPKIEQTLLARLDAAHGVHDLNAIAWCPRAGMDGIFATAGDDGHTKVWKLILS
ncbi:WD40 repeat-like protein [Irpex rosettiformis]|uniref:WD40 repeat-like protein n=1 Tax=Irpex rosettiformis TaxID=378272 RepID=A0ACB8U1Z6_9APHY|nr:WD40 repeat-like protein [Irpex rosettiformis]